MNKTLELFGKWKVEVPAQRRSLYVHSCHQNNQENLLYLICCWDYVFNPSDLKIEGLVRVFIANDSPAMLNVSGVNRRKALALLTNPLSGTKVLKAGGAAAKKQAISKFANSGGAVVGGVGNYNLMTQVIELTLPECMGQVDDASLGEGMLSKLAVKGAGNTQPTAAGRRQVQAIAQNWGAGVVNLSIA
jgi:hypothetical protein